MEERQQSLFATIFHSIQIKCGKLSGEGLDVNISFRELMCGNRAILNSFTVYLNRTTSVSECEECCPLLSRTTGANHSVIYSFTQPETIALSWPPQKDTKTAMKILSDVYEPLKSPVTFPFTFRQPCRVACCGGLQGPWSRRRTLARAGMLIMARIKEV